MNYEILLLEAVRKADPNYLAQYIFKEFKKAEKDHYSSDEFFNGCLSILKQWKKEINRSLELSHAKIFDLENKIHLSKGTEEQKARAIEQLEIEKKILTIRTIAIPIRGENYKLGQLPIGSVKVVDIQKLTNALEEVLQLLNNKTLPPQRSEKPKPERETPKTFEDLFYNPANAEPCLRVLNELQPPVIDAMNNYIGKAKGIFPLWIKILKSHKPKPLIKHFKNTIYKDLLNSKVNGLNLSKDASEFRKYYSRIENSNVELDIKAILSQYSQSGKLGK